MVKNAKIPAVAIVKPGPDTADFTGLILAGRTTMDGSSG